MSYKKDTLSIVEKKEMLCREIWDNSRIWLYDLFPYLDGAFVNVSYRSIEEGGGISFDGKYIWYEKDELISCYRKDPALIVRGYLHMLLHGIFLHLWPDQDVEKELWDLASDMAVERIIDENVPDNLKIQDASREKIWEKLSEKKTGVFELYHLLKTGFFDESIKELALLFSFDHHDKWYQSDQEQQSGKKRIWEKIQLYTKEVKDKVRAGLTSGKDVETFEENGKVRYDYSRFLKDFSVMQEEMELDLESFDYIYYTLGMELYGNLPLIEPLEYRDINKLRELVIAIDTSASCSKEVVQQFLTETLEILNSKENFFHRMNVHIIQCDTHIADVVVVHSQEEWIEYSKKIMIYGRGGTDFRPVFQYIEEKQKAGEIRDLRALLYFTDGDGIYPRQRPPYETAFVFLKEKAKTDQVPDWAITLLI